MLDGILRQLLSIEQLPHILLSRLAITSTDEESRCDVAGDTHAENDGGDGHGSCVVVDAPGTSAKGDLKTGVTVEKDDDSDEVAPREGEMCECLVGFVETVRLGHLLLVMLQALELSKRQSRLVRVGAVGLGVLQIDRLRTLGLGFRVVIRGSNSSVSLRVVILSFDQNTGLVASKVRLFRVGGNSWRYPLLLQFLSRLLAFFSSPDQARETPDEEHVVCIDSTERSQTITHDGEECNKNTVNDMNSVELLIANVDPTNEEENPSQTEECDEGGVERNEETQRSSDILPETLHATLESGTPRVQHMSDVIIQLCLFFRGPSF